MRAPVRVVGYATLQLTTWITNRDVSKVTSSFAAMRHEATSLATELLITTSGPRERVRKRAAGEREREREKARRQRSPSIMVGRRESAVRRTEGMKQRA